MRWPFSFGPRQQDISGRSVSDYKKGILALLAANLIWGFAPILYRALDHVRADETLAHRTIWSFLFFAIFIAFQGRSRELAGLATNKALRGRILLAAVLIAANWGIFIYAIVIGQALQAGFAYYIFPIIAVAFGVLLFKERMQPAQWLAIAIVIVAVATFGAANGAVPYLALVLAVTFALYGIVKRGIGVGPVMSVTAETGAVTLLGVGWLIWLHFMTAGGIAFGQDWYDSLLLILSGPLTGGPMILFSYAAARLNYAELGLIQYMNPTLQTFVAVMLFAEPFSPIHALALGLIWIALAIYSVAAFRAVRAVPKVPMT